MTRKRDPDTGQYWYDDDYERLCKCGHSLGVHSQGGFYCNTDAIGNNEPEALGCECERFKPSGKQRIPAPPATPMPAKGAEG
jgi:hypothetical protein